MTGTAATAADTAIAALHDSRVVVCPHAYRTVRRGPPIQGRRPIEMVIFDMDGVLIDVGSSWRMVHDHFGTDNDDALQAYMEGRIDDAAFVRHDVERWMAAFPQGKVPLSAIDQILQVPPLMEGAEELVRRLHEAGMRTAIVSGGLEQMARKVGEALGIDEVYANALLADGSGHLTGEGLLRTPLNDKAVPVRALLEEHCIDPANVAAVGNSCPDVSMFEHVGHGIAFNPDDDCVVHAADHVYRERDLRPLIDVLLDH